MPAAGQRAEEGAERWSLGSNGVMAWPERERRVEGERLPAAVALVGTWSAAAWSAAERGTGSWANGSWCSARPEEQVCAAEGARARAGAGMGRAGWRALKQAARAESPVLWRAAEWRENEAAMATQTQPRSEGVQRRTFGTRPAAELSGCRPAPAEEMRSPQRLERLRLPSLRLCIPACGVAR